MGNGKLGSVNKCEMRLAEYILLGVSRSFRGSGGR